ncbi:hypothetical protein [Peristeroidobacter soli]|uniref:hypothetical protein n=1 Tax=Peristeroidobacter soli TaxID=2497877 RepID=UPI00101BF8C2|nr:hypothetical protein [Peristeroidobacter soli]
MRTKIGRVGLAMIAALAVCSAARAAVPKEVHINLGSNTAPLMATVRVEDYRAAPLDLLTPVATGDSQMIRFLKAYYEIGRAGDIKKVASLFEPHLQAGVNDYYPTAKSLSEQFADLRTVRLVAVLHWGEYQFGVVKHVSDVGEGGSRDSSWSHAARCFGDTCQIGDHFTNSLLGRSVSAAFADKGAVQVDAPAQSDTPLPMLPAVVDAARKVVSTDPIVLHLDRASDQTTASARKLVSTLTENLRVTRSKQPTFEKLSMLYSAGTPKSVAVFQRGSEVPAYNYSAYLIWFANHAPWTVGSVYSLGPDVCVALLKSEHDRAVHLLPLQRAGTGWAIVSDPSSLDAWPVLSSISAYQALQNR